MHMILKMKKSTIFTAVAFMAMCMVGCGEITDIVEDTVNDNCPMTFEDDFYVPTELLESEVEAMAYEWTTNPNTIANVSIIDDDIWELEIIEGNCNTKTYYFFGIES